MKRTHTWARSLVPPDSARVVHSTSHSDVTLKGRPTSDPYESFPGVSYVLASIERNFVRPTRTRRRCNVFSTSVTNKEVRKSSIRTQGMASAERLLTSCRVSIDSYHTPDHSKIRLRLYDSIPNGTE